MKPTLLVLLALFSFSQCTIFQIDCLQNEFQTIVFFSDFHTIGTPEEATKQRDQIISWVFEHNGFLIVEDGIVYDHSLLTSEDPKPLDGTFFSSPSPEYIIDTMKSPLFFLSLLACKKGIECVNVDFRYLRYRAVTSLKNLIENKKARFGNFSDGTFFNSYYQATLALLEKHFEPCVNEILSQLAFNNNSFGQALQSIQPNVDDQTLQDVCHFACQPDQITLNNRSKNELIAFVLQRYLNYFIEIEMAHAIAQNSNRSLIVVCAGQFHIQQLKRFLSSCNFESCYQTGDRLTHKDGSYHKPTILTLTDHFTILDSVIIA